MENYAQLSYYVIATVVIVGGAVWRLSARLAATEEKWKAVSEEITLMRTNHLHHIEKDIDELKGYIKLFLEHLIKKGQ